MANKGKYDLDAIYEALKSFDNYTAPYEIEVTLELINSKMKNTESTIDELKSRTFYQGNDIFYNLQARLKDAKSYVTDNLVPISRDLYTLKRLLNKRNELKTTKKKTKEDKPYYDYNEGFYDYLINYYVEDGVIENNCEITELQSIEMAIVKLIDDMKYRTLWDKSEAEIALPTYIPLLYGPPPTETPTPVPTVTVAPLYGPPPTETPVPIPTLTPLLYGPPPTQTPIPIPTQTPLLYGPPPTEIVAVPKYGVEIVAPTDIVAVPKYGVEIPTPSVTSGGQQIACTYEDIYGRPRDSLTEEITSYQEIPSIGDKYDEYAYLKPIEDEYALRSVGDTYQEIIGKDSIGSSVVDYKDSYGKISEGFSVADFEDKPRDVAIEIIKKN